MKHQGGGNYDYLASSYDLLAKVAFGGAIQSVQLNLLNYLPLRPNILILGGGTGFILPHIFSRRPHAQVDFVDPSVNMIGMARKKMASRIPQHLHQVCFYPYREINHSLHQKYQVILTPFFLDLFTYQELREVCDRISGRMTDSGLWLWADFVQPHKGGKIWVDALLKGMYAFFAFTTGLENNDLIDIRPLVETNRHFELREEQHYLGGLIQGRVYQRTIFKVP